MKALVYTEIETLTYRDEVDAFAKATYRDNKYGVYHMGTGVSTPVLEVCRIAEKIVLNTDLLTQEIENKFKDSTCDVDFWADCSQSKKYLGWEPSTTLEEGIKRTWYWLKSQ